MVGPSKPCLYKLPANFDAKFESLNLPLLRTFKKSTTNFEATAKKLQNTLGKSWTARVASSKDRFNGAWASVKGVLLVPSNTDLEPALTLELSSGI